MGKLFLDHSLTIIKWTWGLFSKNVQFDYPYNYARKSKVKGA